MRTTLVFTFLLFVNFLFGQLLPNSNFESPEPSTFPDNRSQVDNLLFWFDDSRIVNTTHHYHSPDWYKYDQYYIEENYGNGWVPVLGNNSSNGYVGMFECELIKQRFPQPLNKEEEYTIEFFLRPLIAENRVHQDIERNFSNNGLIRGNIIVELSKKDLTYISNDECELKDDFGSQKISFPINHYGYEEYYPNNWYKQNLSFIAEKEYQYVNVYFEPINDGDGNSEYILLDDFQIYSACDNITCKLNDGEIDPILTSYVYGNNPITGQTSYFTIDNIQNVTEITYRLYNSLGAPPLFYNTVICTNGFNGTFDILIPNSANYSAGIYFLSVSYKNDNCSVDKVYQVEILFSFELFPYTASYECNPVSLVEKCCRDNLVIEEQQIENERDEITYQTKETLEILNCNIIATNPMNFIAEKSIVVENSILGGGGSISLYLENCEEIEPRRALQDGRVIVNEDLSEPIVLKDLDIEKKINLYPNPANTEVSIENLSSQDFDFLIYNSQGVIMKKGVLLNQKTQIIEVESFSKGLYILQTNNNGTIELYRFIKM